MLEPPFDYPRLNDINIDLHRLSGFEETFKTLPIPHTAIGCIFELIQFLEQQLCVVAPIPIPTTPDDINVHAGWYYSSVGPVRAYMYRGVVYEDLDLRNPLPGRRPLYMTQDDALRDQIRYAFQKFLERQGALQKQRTLIATQPSPTAEQR
jgi:hypothetical protein